MPKALELKNIDGRIYAELHFPPLVTEGGSVSLWMDDEVAKQVRDARIAGLREAAEMLAKLGLDFPELAARIAELEKTAK